MTQKNYYDWTIDCLLEVKLSDPDDFLKVKETLTRIGVASRTGDTLYQSCNILHKQGKYFITHFLEMFALDGKPTTLTYRDIERRNTIAHLLEEWGLLKILDKEKARDRVPLNEVKIISYKEKDKWKLVSKYTVGSRKHNQR